MRRLLFPGLALAAGMASCVHINVGPEEEFFRVDSVVDVFGNVNGLDDWDGSILDVGLFTDASGHNEVFNIEIGPLFAFGVGLFGTRVRVLPLEFGVGALFYNARSKKPKADKATIEDGREKAPPETAEPDEVKADEQAPPARQAID